MTLVKSPSDNARILAATLAVLATLALWPWPAMAGDAGGHSDPIAPVILGVTGVLFFAFLGRFGARRYGQPSVLGELLMGVVLGNVGYYLGSELIAVLRQGPEVFGVVELMLAGEPVEQAMHATIPADSLDEIRGALEGPHALQYLQVAHAVDVFSRYGVIFLLFIVGLETSVEELRRVGRSSTLVAVVGLFLPFMLGFATVRLLMPGLPLATNLFIAATLGATSVGITARVLRDIGRQQSTEAHVILGAAVIDDILGLLMLAIVSGIVVSGGVELGNVAWTVTLALAFLAGAIVLGPRLIRLVVRYMCALDIVEAKMFTSYFFVMVLAWMANLVGLATIVGAFTAGLILHDAYFRDCQSDAGRTYSIKDLIMPLEVILVPIFFVLMGIQVKLETFTDPQVLVMAAGLLAAAIAGKVAAGWAAGRGVNHLAVGIGMMPRGEVGLIFAAVGKTLGVIDDFLFSSVVLMVIVTTLIAPPLLKVSMRTRTAAD